MITANIAGSAGGGSHVRSGGDRHRDSDSCNSEDLREIEAELQQHTKHHRPQNGGPDTRTSQQREADDAEAQRIRQRIIEHRRKRFCKDYKTIAYLSCVGFVLIGAIVLVILFAMGIFSIDNNER